MNASTVKEILSMEAGIPVIAIEAKLANVWDRATGESDKGEWSRQSAGLKIGSETIRVTFWGFPDLKKDKGKSFRIESTKGKRGWYGIMTEDNTWKMDNDKADAPERELKINDSAKMMPLSGSGNVDASTTSTTSTAKHLDSGSPIQQVAASSNKPMYQGDPYQRATNQLTRVKNGILMVYDAIDEVIATRLSERNISNEEKVQLLITGFKAIDIDSLPLDLTAKPDAGQMMPVTHPTPTSNEAPKAAEPMTPEKAEEILGGGEPAEDAIPF